MVSKRVLAYNHKKFEEFSTGRVETVKADDKFQQHETKSQAVEDFGLALASFGMAKLATLVPTFEPQNSTDGKRGSYASYRFSLLRESW